MIDATVLARHKAICSRAYVRRDGTHSHMDGWTLSGMGDASHITALPPALRGNLLSDYESRRDTVTVAASRKNPDPLFMGGYEARISRRLGFRARAGFPSYVYWRHIPIMRLEANGPAPHILISPYHAGGKAQLTRAMFAANNMLDYLMTGVRLSMDGVSIAWRHETTPWPKALRKPGVYIPVLGNHLKSGKPFWTAAGFQFVMPKQLSLEGGKSYDPVEPWVTIEGLI